MKTEPITSGTFINFINESHNAHTYKRVWYAGYILALGKPCVAAAVDYKKGVFVKNNICLPKQLTLTLELIQIVTRYSALM